MALKVESLAVPARFKANDASAGRALNELARKEGPITGEQLARAIARGTSDRDNQSAGVEYADFARFAAENQARLTPEAKAVMAIYEKHAMGALRKGQTGIANADYKKMMLEMQKASVPARRDLLLPPKLRLPDASAKQAVEELSKKPAPISGEDLRAAIETGTADADNQAAGKEFAEFAKFAKRHGDKLSPEAKEVMAIYEKYAKAARAKGQTGIENKQFSAMLNEMRNVHDSSARRAVGELASMPSPISGEDLAKAIEVGTKDPDGQAAAKEFAEFARFAKEHGDKLSPEAKEVMAIYEKYAKAAQAKGRTGLPERTYLRMLDEMSRVGDSSARAALAELDKKKAPISGEDFAAAINKGTADLDNNAAAGEFRAYADWARKNGDKLSPEAKEVMAIYEKYAKAAQAKGQTGIANFDQMLTEMGRVQKFVDSSAGAALTELGKKPGMISAGDLARAIDKGTRDADGQAAGTEFADFAKWAANNKDRLSAGAKKVMAVYERYATAALKAGQTGIPLNEYEKMVAEMRRIGSPLAGRFFSV